ncbi:MAG: ATP-binding cassette domain-containing protein [Bryobacteraceae bacterium]|jgi:iron complex transport system ATP-binding protein
MAQSAAAQPPIVEFRNVTVDHGAFRALHDISLAIHAGEHTAILGPNGSGKSTLLKVLTRECYPRLLEPAPEVRILGQDAWRLFDLRAALGIVTNELAEKCTKPYPLRETVLSGFFGSIGVWPYHEVTAGMEEKARAVMDLLEITGLAEREMTAMSSGEQRRAVIARALVHDPRALVLDEPTNSLDIHATRELRRTLRRLAAAGITIILVTHHLPDIIPEIGRVVALKRGRILADGPKAEILRAGTLSAIFDTPVEVMETSGYYHMW